MVTKLGVRKYERDVGSYKEGKDVLDDNSAIVGELLKVWLKGKVIMHRFDVRR